VLPVFNENAGKVRKIRAVKVGLGENTGEKLGRKNQVGTQMAETTSLQNERDQILARWYGGGRGPQKYQKVASGKFS